MLGIHGRLVVLVAIQAGKHTVVRTVCMTFRTGAPFSPMGATVNGEILAVMVESSWFPGINAMAWLAFL